MASTLKKKETQVRLFASKNLLWFAGFALAIINLWLASKLSPLVQNIKVLDIRVMAVETGLNTHEASNNESLKVIQSDVKEILKEVGNLKQFCHP